MNKILNLDTVSVSLLFFIDIKPVNGCGLICFSRFENS